MTTKKKEKFDFKTITSVEAAFKKCGFEEPVYPETSKLPEKYGRWLLAYYILIIAAEAVNDGWVPEPGNRNQPKWYMYGWVSGSGPVFTGSSCDGDCSGASAAFPLYFESREKAWHVFENFKQQYEVYFLNAIHN